MYRESRFVFDRLPLTSMSASDFHQEDEVPTPLDVPESPVWKPERLAPRCEEAFVNSTLNLTGVWRTHPDGKVVFRSLACPQDVLRPLSRLREQPPMRILLFGTWISFSRTVQ